MTTETYTIPQAQEEGRSDTQYSGRHSKAPLLGTSGQAAVGQDHRKAHHVGHRRLHRPRPPLWPERGDYTGADYRPQRQRHQDPRPERDGAAIQPDTATWRSFHTSVGLREDV